MSERFDWRPSQDPKWIDVSGEPEFSVKSIPGKGFLALDFQRQVSVQRESLEEAKKWCEFQWCKQFIAERDK